MFRQQAILKLPLVAASAVAIVWLLGKWRPRSRGLLGACVGLCLGWGLALHLTQDVTASQWVRRIKAERTRALAPVLTNHSALLAYRGFKDSASPLLFDRDIVILDVRADMGASAPALVREMLGQVRWIFLLADGMAADFPSARLETSGSCACQPIQCSSANWWTSGEEVVAQEQACLIA